MRAPRPLRLSFRPSFLAALCLFGCSGAGLTSGAPATTSDASATDAPGSVDVGDGLDAASIGTDAGPANADAADGSLAALTPCPTALLDGPAPCYTVLPTVAGADPSGDNAANVSIALAPPPSDPSRQQLVLFLVGSNGTPAEAIASPTVNFYETAASLGYAVLAVSYRDRDTVAKLCTPDGGVWATDSCYFPTRESLLRGVYQAGAASGVADVTLDEGIAGRTLMTLQYLAARDPAGGWDLFFTSGSDGAPPETRLVWSRIVAAGHSQGGGHAAVIGKLFPVPRVVQLSSTCDAVGVATPATWTTGATAPWASDPTMFWGLDAKTTFTNGLPTGGDTTCFAHLAVWTNLGMQSARQNDGAVVCSKAPSAHGASVDCAENASAWEAMLE